MKRILILMGAILSLASCEKEIDLDLNTANPKFVIEAELPQNEVAKVTISKTVNFSEPNNFPAVKAAIVTLSDEKGNTEQLIEIGNGIYSSQRIKGIVGTTYTLTVRVEGNLFTAKSNLPKQVRLTGVKSELSTLGLPSPNAVDNYILFPEFIDPSELGNNYRFLQTRNGITDKNIIVSNDNLGNGKPNQRPLVSRGFEIGKGDKVRIEMQSIDAGIYNYFYTLSSIAGNGPGGGTAPSNPVSNFSGGALGYFSAYSKDVIMVEIK